MVHAPPIWVTETPDFFITICTEPKGRNQLCHSKVRTEILTAIGNYHERNRWYCHVGVLMPDHVHFLLSFPDIPNYSRTVGEWKRWLVKRCQIKWQENFFSHRIRNEEQDRWKSDYILHNPVRAK